MLEIKNLNIEFKTRDGTVHAVNEFSCKVSKNETLAIVGESGSGKSQTVLSIMGLLASNSNSRGEINFNNKNLLKLSNKELNSIRGNKISMIFQDPMTSLNPYKKIGSQLIEVILEHKNTSKATAKLKVLEMLEAVKISEPGKRYYQYPHELSGGMRQRVMIALSLLCEPELLIADEPTTALDVTVQAGIMKLLKELQQKYNFGIILITHDLGVVAGFADSVIVMYAGNIMEQGLLNDIFYKTSHPYTIGLLKSMPGNIIEQKSDKLFTIPGNPPSVNHKIKGCSFYERCTVSFHNCKEQKQSLNKISSNHFSSCIKTLSENKKFNSIVKESENAD